MSTNQRITIDARALDAAGRAASHRDAVPVEPVVARAMVAPSRAATRAVRPPAHVFDRAFYAKLAGVSFVIGAAFEAFMLKTDFYAKVVHIEAERRFLAEQRRARED